MAASRGHPLKGDRLLDFDFIIVGAGSAGCALAHRLSANPAHRVLVLEAGKDENGLIVRMPKGFGKLLFDRHHVRRFDTEPEPGNGQESESWPRGRMLGGSSTVNGMFYTRGQAQDFDDWAALGNPGWGWSDIGPCFKAMEDHELGADQVRGAGGPLRVSCHPNPHPLCDATIAAGAALGLPVRDDLNRPDHEGIGYVQFTIRDGRREDAASAFLRPVMQRPNLEVVTHFFVERVIIEQGRAVGVRGRHNGQPREYRARREVILAAGALQSPQLLQLSGIGPAAHLAQLGIEVVHDLPGVGQNLREHRMFVTQFRLRQPLSLNGEFGGWRLGRNVLRYLLARRGLMATGSHDVVAFLRSEPELDRPDVELVMAPFSLLPGKLSMAFEKVPGMQLFGFQLRPQSQGSVLIRSADPAADPEIRSNFLTADVDRASSGRILRAIRRLVAQPPLAGLLDGETAPGAAVQTDAEAVDWHAAMGGPVAHIAGTCRMGSDAMAVVDAQLRVHGVAGLRVVDCSIMPTLVSAHTNAAAMVIGWRAADFIDTGHAATVTSGRPRTAAVAID